MKKFYEIGQYMQLLELEGDIVTNVSCSCKDFTFRKIKPVGSGADKKYIVDDICKHLQAIILSHNFQLNLPKIDDNIGPTKCPISLFRELLDEFNGCQICGSKDCLQVHRIKRGNSGGKYIKSNVKLLCINCHKQIHQKEFK
jgi:hypothetical protein